MRTKLVDAARGLIGELRLANANELLRVACLLVAASFLATQDEYLDRGDRGMWWGDGHYNLLRSYYVLKGYKLYDEIVSGQFPGLQTLYAFFLWPLGFGRVRPSSETFAAIESAGLFINGALQGFFFYLAFRAARVAASFGLLFSIVLVYVLWEQHGYYYPLVETILVPTVALMVGLLARIFFDGEVDWIRAALYLWGVLVFAGLLGLTIAPTILLWGAVSLVAIAPAFRRRLIESRGDSPTARVGRLGGWTALAPLGASVVFALWTWTSMGFRTAYYWTVTSPSEHEHFNLLRHLWLAVLSWRSWVFHFSPCTDSVDVIYFPRWALPQFVLLLLAIYFASLLRREAPGSQVVRVWSRPALPAVAFSICIVIGYLLIGWRYPGLTFDHKKIPELGISIGLLALILGRLVPAGRAIAAPPASIAPQGGLRRSLTWATAVVITVAAAWPYRAPATTSARSDVFDTAGVCRLGEARADRSCLLQASYDPRRFLEYDVQPCLGYSPEQPFTIQHSRRSREQFEGAVDDRGIAFFMGDSKESVTIWDISSEVYDRIISSRTCIPLYGIFRICYPPERQSSAVGSPPKSGGS